MTSVRSRTPLSHESRLGIMVISILVFAFCFLVYHRMDLKQRALTQASIQSSASKAAQATGIEEHAAYVQDPDSISKQDPLMKIRALNEESLFANGSGNSSGQPNSDSLAETDVVLPAQETPFAFSEPDGAFAAETRNDILSTAAAVAMVDSAQAPYVAAEDRGVVENIAQFPEISLREQPAEIANDDPSSLERHEALLPQDKLTAADETDELTQLLSAGEPVFSGENLPRAAETEIVPEPEFAKSESDSAHSAMDLAKSGNADIPERPEFFLPAETESPDTGESPAVQLPSMADSAETSNTRGPEQTTITFNELNDSTGGVLRKTDTEEVLLAMADPPASGAFSGGLIDDNPASVSGAAPVSEPADSFPFPDLGAEPQREQSRSDTAQRATSFGNGFQAVTNPGGQRPRNSVRTAAGSGADGRFSLAAFNYQNNSAEPAPDDGQTFDSVVVEQGDNYSKISKRVYGTSRYFSALAVFNQHRIPEPKNMRPGMVVLTPRKEILEERYPQLFADLQPKVVKPAEFLLLDDGSPAYRAGERETLSQISERFLGRSARWIEIYRLNQSVVKDPNKLKPGIILALPADAVEVQVVP